MPLHAVLVIVPLLYVLKSEYGAFKFLFVPFFSSFLLSFKIIFPPEIILGVHSIRGSKQVLGIFYFLTLKNVIGT